METNIISEMVGAVVDGVGVLPDVGKEIVDFFDVAVVNASGGLTTFATWSLAFLGVTFGLGAIGWVIGKIRNR